jgi:hypothetical protein
MCFAMPFRPNFSVEKHQNAKTALRNALKDHILDFGLGKLKRKLLMSRDVNVHVDRQYMHRLLRNTPLNAIINIQVKGITLVIQMHERTTCMRICH